LVHEVDISVKSQFQNLVLAKLTHLKLLQMFLWRYPEVITDYSNIFIAYLALILDN